jgi:sugar phosphate isomerase/epimerase
MIFVSTSCLRGNKNIKDALEELAKEKILGIELGATHVYEKGIIEFLKDFKKKYNTEFLVHAFFPPEKNPFIVNLASQDPKILQKSVKHAKKAINTTKKINAKVYSFHAGFRVDPDELGEPFNKKNIGDYEDCYATFVKSVEKICKYAKQKNVKIALENHQLSKRNLVNGKNEFLLLCELHEVQRFYKDLDETEINNLGFLLDLGHLNVTSNSLKFDRDEFVEWIKSRVFEVHIHENNGIEDQHLSLKKNSWFMKTTSKFFRNSTITLEARNLYIKDIKEQIRLLENLR